MKPADFFSEDEKNRITEAIGKAECNTSGEIRVHIENSCHDPLDRAAYIFEKLKMHKTALRNGVLFYLSVHDRKFAILGDAGIHAKVPENFWDTIKQVLFSHFKEGQFCTGLCKAILMAGEQLKEHFPYTINDRNELSDEVTFS